MAMSSQSQSSQSGELTSDDLQEVFEALYSITSNYVPFGMKLNVPLSTIRATEKQYANPCDCLIEILDFRLKQLPLLTWRDIVQALRSPIVQQHDLARTIESQYITASQSPASVSQQASAESSHAAIHTSGAQPSTHVPPQPPLHTVAAASVALTHTPIALPQPPVDGVPTGQWPLTSNDLPHLLNVLNSVASKCYYIGLQLGVKIAQITIIRLNYTNCEVQLREILVERLKQAPLTWQDIVTALRADSVREYGLASEIESIHILSLHPPTSVAPQVSTDSSISPATQCVSSHAPLQPSLHEVHSDPPQAKRPRYDTSVAQLSEPLPPQGSVTSQHDALYPPEFTSYVKRVYRRSKVGNPKDTKWPPMASKHFINLVIINRETVSLDEADEYIKSLVLHGDLDAILHEKQPTKMSDVAKDVPEGRIILVEGAPGVGKSTFAWEFCRRWERGEIAQQYQLVLLLRLRDEGMSYAKSLEDLIRLYHHSDTLCQTVLRTLKASRGESSLIILEGFDELPDTCRTESSVFLKLISGKVLEKATVLITSRHRATRIIHQTNEDRIFQHIEILGFTEPQIKEYIKSINIDTQTDPDQIVAQKINEMVTYVEKFPQIKACMYIPLNTAIVVNVYQESKANCCILPRTLTELYYALTQILLLRYLYGHPEYGQEDWVVRDIKRDIPEDVFTKLLNICHEAYKGICTVGVDSVQLIFYLRPDFETLGFMQSVPQLYTTQGAVVSHNFLHLTVQEFLAALHISFMSPEQQLLHLKRHKEGTLKVVLRFLAGLTKLKHISLDQIKGLFGKPLQENESSQGKCCTRMAPDISVGVHHTNWMFETQSTEIIKTLLENGTVEFVCEKGMVPLEYCCVGYCIAHSQCNWCLTFVEDMEDEKLEMFLTEIKKSGGGTEHRVAVKTDRPMSSEKLNTLFAALGPWLEELYLTLADNGSSLSLTNLSALHILELGMCSGSTFNISNGFSLQSLESLTINANNKGSTLGLKSCNGIGKLLSTFTSLKELYFKIAKGKKWGVGSKGMDVITKGLSDNMALPLRSLEIECKCTFSNMAAKSLALFVRNSTALKYVRMCNVQFSGCGLIELTEALLHCSSLQEKKLENLLLHSIASDDEVTKLNQMFHDHPDMLHCIDWKSITFRESCDDARVIAIAVHHNLNQETLYLRNNVSDAGATALAQALHHNSTLERLNLSNNSISDVGATALAQALHHNSTLKMLWLSHNNISDAGATDLAQALYHNSTLKELNLSHNSISDAGGTDLAQALHHNSTLEMLDLSHNVISDAGARNLAQALHHNSTLERLDLSHNVISDAGGTNLAQALHHNSSLVILDLSCNNRICNNGLYQLTQSLMVNSSIGCGGLILSKSSEEYVTHYPQYDAIKLRIAFEAQNESIDICESMEVVESSYDEKSVSKILPHPLSSVTCIDISEGQRVVEFTEISSYDEKTYSKILSHPLSSVTKGILNLYCTKLCKIIVLEYALFYQNRTVVYFSKVCYCNYYCVWRIYCAKCIFYFPYLCY